MTPLDTFQTLELSTLRLTLREGLRFVPQRFGDETCVVVEDEPTGRCFRIGPDEYALISRFDGRRSIGQAMAEASVETREPLNEDEVARVCSWLIDQELATTPTSSRTEKQRQRRRRKARAMLPSKLNPISIRIPLFDPDPLLRRLDGLGRLAFSPIGLVLWLLAVGWGLVVLGESWSELFASRATLISPHVWPLIAVSMLVLKLLHEAAHGLACRAVGGRPRQAGVLLLLLLPLPFVDVSSAWLCPSKWRRVLVSAAGMLVELAVAGLALGVWSTTDSLVVREAMVSLVAAATVVTVLFNANPLMKFDGYYMLADAIGLPNLAGRAQSVVRGLTSKALLGQTYVLTEPRWPTLLVYGVAAAVWRVVVWVSLLTAACVMFRGAGKAIAAVALATWLGPMLWKAGRRLMAPKETDRPIARWRVATLTACVCGLVMSIAFGLQRPSSVELPGVVVAEDAVTVRPPTPGFVREVHAVDGQWVDAGQLLLALDNPELFERAETLELEWMENELKARGHHQASETAQWQARQERGASILKRLAETRQAIEELSVRAEVDGVLSWPESDAWRGRYLASGEAVCQIEPAGSREIVALIAQDQLVEVSRAEQWRCRIDGVSDTLRLTALPAPEPRAVRSLPHRALGADAGGSVAVRPTSRDGVELAEPHVRVRVALPSERRVPSGTRVILKASSQRTVLQDVYDALPML